MMSSEIPLNDTDFRYPSTLAQSLPLLNKVLLDNVLSRHSFPEWVFRREGKERRFTGTGLWYLGLYAQLAIGLRMASPDACAKLATEILQKTGKHLADKGELPEFFALRAGLGSENKDGVRAPQLFGPLSATFVASRISPDLASEQWPPLVECEPVSLIPVRNLIDRITRMISEFNEGDANND